MEHCCENCTYHNTKYIHDTIYTIHTQDFCEKSGKAISLCESEEHCCDNYKPDYYTAQSEKEEIERNDRSAKQRLMLRDLKGFLESYNAEDYEDNSPDVLAIYKVVKDMVYECDPSRVVSTLDWD